jgi:ferritin
MATTPQQVIDLVVSFERDLASFYDDLLLEPHLKPLENICRFMAQHSLIHAEMIANYRSDANIPQLQVTPLTTLHNRLKTSLRKEIAATGNINEAADRLSRAEEIISMAYARIAEHYEEVADTYRKISSKFKSLADDERQHQDYIRREQARLEPALDDSPPGRDH